MTQEQQAFETWLRLRWRDSKQPFLRPCNDVDPQQTYQDPDAEWAYVAWQASRESLRLELLRDEMVEKISDVIASKTESYYSEDQDSVDAAKAALKAVVGEL